MYGTEVAGFENPALSTKPTDGVLILKKLGDYRPLIPRYYMHRTTTLGSSPLEKQVFTNQLTQKWLNIFLSPTYPCFTFPGIYSRSFFPNFPRRNARSVSIVLHCIHYIFYCFHLYIWLTFYADATDFEYAGERLIPEVFTYSLFFINKPCCYLYKR